MSIQALPFRSTKLAGGLFALMASMGTMQATNLLTATTPALTCSTTAGPGAAQTITVKSAATVSASAPITVTFAAPTGGLVVTPASAQITSTVSGSAGAGVSFSVVIAPGCSGAVANSSAPTIQFKANGVNDVLVTTGVTVTAGSSALVSSPSTIALTCSKAGSLYTPGAAKTVTITSAATGGTPFTVDTSGTPPPAWLTLNSSGGTATSGGTTFTAVAAAGCGAFSGGTTTNGSFQLLNAPAPAKVINVTLQTITVPSTPLTAAPTPASGSLTYVKGSGSPGYVDVAVSSSNPVHPFFTVDTTTLPVWLNVDSASGTAPKSIRFSSTALADTLAPGTYSATVHLTVSGYGDALVPLSMLVTNPSAHLTVQEGTTRNLTWTIGSPVPSVFMTLVSTDSPVPYTITTAGSAAPVISASLLKGLAYSFGSAIPVTFDPLVYAAAQPGTVLTGTATVTWGNPASSIVVVFNTTVQSAGATITSVAPASLPTAAPQSIISVSLIGTGFVVSTDPTQKTTVGIVVGNSIVADTNISATVINSSHMTLTFTVPVSPDTYLPFSPSGPGGSVNIGVCNPLGSSCSIPTGTVTLPISNGPIIQGVSSASSFQQVTPPALQTMAPYDLISIFGSGFCSSGGSGCASNAVLFGSPDPVTLRYPMMLSPDSAGATQRQLSVTFQTHGANPTPLGTAALLFATNNQINLIAPSGISAGTVDIVVSFGYTGHFLTSSVYPVTVRAANPGIFTVGSDGQGDAAALGANLSIVSVNNPAGMRTTASTSDTIQIYMTGLGIPNSTASNATGGGNAYAGDCVSIANYLSSLSTASGVSVSAADGAVVQSSLLDSSRLAPCMVTAPTVTVGGLPAHVTYAGWVADSIAGLYQVNATLPGRAAGTFATVSGSTFTNLLAPAQLPLVVTAGGFASQSNVSIWVAPQLAFPTLPTGAGLSGTVGVPWASSNNRFVAGQGTSTYSYAVTSGLLPPGLSLGASTGAITGTPAANTSGSYAVSVTATDSASIPVTGVATVKLVVAGGLFMNSNPSGNFTPGVGSAAYPGVTTIQPSGGIAPYTYALASNPTAAGITVDPNTGIVSVDATVAAGAYTVTVTATDSTTGTPLTGSITFTITLS